MAIAFCIMAIARGSVYVSSVSRWKVARSG
jgi:hypothetical protein